MQHEDVFLQLVAAIKETVATLACGVGGFLLPNFLATISQDDRMTMGGQVIAELKTTIADVRKGPLE